MDETAFIKSFNIRKFAMVKFYVYHSLSSVTPITPPVKSEVLFAALLICIYVFYYLMYSVAFLSTIFLSGSGKELSYLYLIQTSGGQ